ncbi:MAG: DUF1738 domain-containing protein [Gammaproteobacteria bacterium]|nr:DUF1738 domain-containing protein [Gammaproteobacteria bacterium]
MSYQHDEVEVTQQIIRELENGIKLWERPWDNTQQGPITPQNLKTRTEYSGFNIVLLWAYTRYHGYGTHWWLTEKQAETLGGRIYSGERPVYIRRFIPVAHCKDGITRRIGMRFPVFNRDQVTGLIPPPDIEPTTRPVPKATRILRASGATIRISGVKACYSPSDDLIVLPPADRFPRSEDYYATALHELVHWTGHSSRLNRTGGERFGDAAYAFEELVAELGSVFLSAKIGLAGELNNHANYIGYWLDILSQDRRALWKAASLAQKASNFLLNCPQ